MKYVVKCPYCGHNYIVDAREDEKDFQCETCGGQNGLENVVEKINKPIVVEKEVVKKVVEQEKDEPIFVDPDLKEIRNFDMSDYPADDDSYEYGGYDSSDGNKTAPIVLIIIVIVFLLFVVTTPKQETREEQFERELQERRQEREEKAKNSREARLAEEVINQWMQAMNGEDIGTLLNCYNIPEESFVGEDELREIIKSSELEALWGSDVRISSINFKDYAMKWSESFMMLDDIGVIRYQVVFSNDDSEIFIVDSTESGEMKIRLESDNVVSDVKIRTALQKGGASTYASLFINDKRVNCAYEEVEDINGYKYSEYTIPLMVKGDYVFKIKTTLGELSMSCKVKEDDQAIVMNQLQVAEEERAEIAADLQDIWKRVQSSALNYAEPSAFRQFFDKRVTDEEIEELAKQIRMEHDLRGDYEGAYLTDVKIAGNSFCAVNYDTFIVRVVAEYQSANVNHASGQCISTIVITADGDGWQIYDAQDNSFFTLAGETQQEEG